MYRAKVTLTIVHGNPEGREYVFEDQTWNMIGRGDDCDLQLPRDQAHIDISRHHCMLEVDLPTVRLRDLGSRNGTFVNGMKIGQRAGNDTPGEFDLSSFSAHELHEGDEIQVGHVLLRVGIPVTEDVLQNDSSLIYQM